MIDINNFDAIEIGLASSKQIRSWSSGEVTKPETINYRTLKPEKDGLFCERIFGPTKDWECYCGKYKRVRYKGIVCERCGVEVTRSKVRRERMGHIDLAAPVSHIWFFKGVPSRIGYLLDMAPKELEKVLYFAASMVTWVDEDARAADLEELAGKVNESLDEYAAEKNLRLQEIDESLERREEYLRSGSEKGFGDEDHLWAEHLDIEVKKLEDDERAKHIKDMRKSLEADRSDTEAYIEDAMERLRQVWDLFQDMTPKQVVNDETLFRELKERFGSPYGWGEYFRGGMGAESVRDLLEQVNLEEERVELEDQVRTAKGQKQQRAVKRLKVVSAFLHSGNKPEMMILEAVPVIPPELRPMVQLDGGRFATSDLNDLYRRVINRNNRLKRLLDLGAPEIIVNNEKRMLQEAVDALFDNGRRGRPVTGPGNRALKSLSDMLKGKQGRFRQNLLGKRVDYSGRSVIVAGPSLRLHQCGLPKLMALELFKPFIMARLVERKAVQNIKAAKKMVDSMIPEVWDVLEEVIHEHPVLLNRAPTLHRLGIQAFEPVLVEGKAIQVHPLVCHAFNADFDGDQMAVHLPLSAEAQAEARVLMLSSNNILSPAHGAPLATPTQDMILGTYYLTYGPETEELEKIDPATFEPKVHVFRSAQEAELAYEHNLVQLHNVAQYRPGWVEGGHILTTVGRIIFNDKIERALEDTMGEEFDRSAYTFINKSLRKRDTTQFVDDLVQAFGAGAISQVLDAFKDLGFRFATQAGITISKNDVVVPPSKEKILAKYEERVANLQEQYEDGLITQEERHIAVTDQWNAATDEVADAMIENIQKTDQLNSIYMMASSGARGSFKQIRQLAGMRGLMANPKGEIIERPVKANFMEGLDVIEYFTSTHGARKGLADTALRTADSGYLTRRLVDVSQDVIIRIEDCGTTEFLESPLWKADGEPNEMLLGRAAAADVKVGKEFIVKKGVEIDRHIFAALQTAFPLGDVKQATVGDGVVRISVRSTLKCEATVGVCQKCYGRAMATGQTAMIGDAVGIVAAQSIGEPGTQLTMRTFHTGGVAGADITHGLPRVVELFEARKPKGLAQIAAVDGTVTIEDTDKSRTVVITDEAGEEHRHAFPRRTRLHVANDESIKAGKQLNEGSLYPHELLELRGRTETEVYLVKEVQEVYKSQGVDIHDKHIELIVRQMLKKVRVEQKGDSDLLPGQFVDRHEFKRINDKVIAGGGEPAQFTEIILGITKASLATDSFLSAASFQETTKVLTDAALEGKIDRLAGLKENVIIGKLIPAATGLKRYRSIEIEPSEPLPRGIDDVGLLDGDDLAAELGLDDGEGLQGFGPAFDTTELDEINAGFGPAGGSFDDIGADLDSDDRK
ncbi:DNA-directed RNA polymerase subunit beta' [Solirubrobacter taibaiensis]|nr:DNA-directed RNA polymerase subunit beta' [Solirubrobacter taibaiensis]